MLLCSLDIVISILEPSMKLHVGCGDKHLPGFTNVDIRFLPNVDVVDNAMFLRKFKDIEVTAIYACHVLEHFTRWEAKGVLNRWYMLLQPGGVLRIAVPDFNAVAEAYVEGVAELQDLLGLLYGGQDYAENFHHHCWDFEMLERCLYNVGFRDIGHYNWQEFLPPEFDDYSKCYLPHMDTSGRLMSLNITARKD